MGRQSCSLNRTIAHHPLGWILRHRRNTQPPPLSPLAMGSGFLWRSNVVTMLSDTLNFCKEGGLRGSVASRIVRCRRRHLKNTRQLRASRAELALWQREGVAVEEYTIASPNGASRLSPPSSCAASGRDEGRRGVVVAACSAVTACSVPFSKNICVSLVSLRRAEAQTFFCPGGHVIAHRISGGSYLPHPSCKIGV